MQVINGLFVLIFTSPVDFILMLIGGEYFPHKPNLDEITEGSWYHKAKGYWAQSFRDDGEWWSKFARFVIWWETFLLAMFIL